MSVRDWTRPHAGGHHSAGHPSHGDAMNSDGGFGGAGSDSSSDTPSGSPEAASGGPTLAGGTPAGLSFGVMSSGGGAANAVNRRLTLAVQCTRTGTLCSAY